MKLVMCARAASNLKDTTIKCMYLTDGSQRLSLGLANVMTSRNTRKSVQSASRTLAHAALRYSSRRTYCY